MIFHASDTFLSICDLKNPSRHVGFRVVEDRPETAPRPPNSYAGQPRRRADFPLTELPAKAIPRPDLSGNKYAGDWRTEFRDELVSFILGEAGTALFRYRDTQHKVVRVSVFRPVEDGLDAWMWLEASEEVPGAFIVQQCLRFTGRDNEKWRHKIALAPELSEFDLWKQGRLQSLTYICRADSFVPVEPVREFAVQTRFSRVTDLLLWDEQERGKSLMTTFRTAAGAAQVESHPEAAEYKFWAPHGLIVRESADRRLVSGMYWERSAKISNHHPADCLHSYVDLGPAFPGRRNVVSGKIYLFEGTKEDLMQHWKKDFPTRGTD